MLRKLAVWIVLVLMLTALALAEDTAPSFVDRITKKDASPEFAFAEDAQLMHLVFPNVKNADSAVIIFGDEVVVIDAASGPQGIRVGNLLKQLGVDEVDLIINTHPHYDHLLGLERIAMALPVKEIAFAFPEDEPDIMKQALKMTEKYGIAVSWYGDGAVFKVGDAVIDTWIKGDPDWTLNERSAVMRLSWKNSTALFTADTMSKAHLRLMEVIEPELLDCDILKYPHHGLERINEEFLKAVSPEFAVITNLVCDETKNARRRLSQYKVPFAVTSPGYLAFCTDGETWLAEKIEMKDPGYLELD